MRRTRYPSAGPASTKKEHPAKINLTKKLAIRSALTRRKPRSPVKFFALYDTTIFDAFSRQSSRSRGLCGCQPTQYQPNDTMTTTKAFEVHGKFTPVFFFQTNKVLISAMHFKTAQAALDCPPHDERMAISRQTFERYNGHRVLIAR